MTAALSLFDLAGRVALVTGASRGIGARLARGLAEAGADLALTARSEPALTETVRAIEATGRRALALAHDAAEVEGAGTDVRRDRCSVGARQGAGERSAIAVTPGRKWTMGLGGPCAIPRMTEDEANAGDPPTVFRTKGKIVCLMWSNFVENEATGSIEKSWRRNQQLKNQIGHMVCCGALARNCQLSMRQA